MRAAGSGSCPRCVSAAAAALHFPGCSAAACCCGGARQQTHKEQRTAVLQQQLAAGPPADHSSAATAIIDMVAAYRMPACVLPASHASMQGGSRSLCHPCYIGQLQHVRHVRRLQGVAWLLRLLYVTAACIHIDLSSRGWWCNVAQMQHGASHPQHLRSTESSLLDFLLVHQSNVGSPCSICYIADSILGRPIF